MKPGSAWPIGIAGLLAASVIANLALMRVAGSDPSMAIEPDYYKKAVAFDSTMADERRSNATGWSAVTTLDAVVPGRSTRVHVRLSDSSGTSVPDATVQVVALFNARANDLQQVELQRDADDSYGGLLTITHPGQWEVRVHATRGGAVFRGTSRVEAVVAVATVDSNGGARP